MTTSVPIPISKTSARARPGRPAFTLTEVLISVALVLVLILGVNQVFSLTGRAVGAGQAISEITRQARGAQSVFTQDLANADFDRCPFVWINSTTMAAFRNKADQTADIDFNPALQTAATVD